ncbi:ATP-binding response regulator [Noviherbaspirillum pedocola]|uniref:Response regulator n=1 Tax=Noviherbaspirillum pedocola TaxID=2801341 RepID=A0A934W5P3_9BURK|nr:response regulator [Noviherbaspirillum pedocola]MBK4733438.1 response regulator [Noviherbaspirillum pedocola]
MTEQPMHEMPSGSDEERDEIESRMRSYAAITLALAADVEARDLAARVLPAVQEEVCGIALFASDECHEAPQLRSHAGFAAAPTPEAVNALLGPAGRTERDRLVVFEVKSAPPWLEQARACAAVPFTLEAHHSGYVLFALRSAAISRAFAAEINLIAQRMGDCLLGQARRSAAPGADADADAAPVHEVIKVLLIDDEPMLMAHIRRLLRQRGFAFHAAERGQHGLDLAASVQPDAILVDKLLPDMDGIDVLRALRRNERLSTVPVIMLSGHADEESRVRALRAGADDFVAKPFSAKELVARIRANVRMAQARRAEVRRESELMRLRQSQQELRKLLDTIQSVRVDERRRLAREVHDQLGQLLTAAKIELRLLEERSRTASSAPVETVALGELRSALSSIDMAIASVQNISILLRPPALERGGLLAALRWLTADWQRRTHLSCRLVHDTAGYVEPSQFVAGELLRICQEALTNVLRHANASAVTIHIGVRGLNFVVRIHDNGVGIARETACSADAIGLTGMRERAASIRASLRIHGRPGCGTIVAVRRRLAIL